MILFNITLVVFNLILNNNLVIDLFLSHFGLFVL